MRKRLAWWARAACRGLARVMYPFRIMRRLKALERVHHHRPACCDCGAVLDITVPATREGFDQANNVLRCPWCHVPAVQRGLVPETAKEHRSKLARRLRRKADKNRHGRVA